MPSRVTFFLSLLALTFVLRLTPYVLTAYDHVIDPGVLFYPWNFMPLTATCLYAGAYFANRLWAVALPLVTLLLSNLGIWAITGNFSWGFPGDNWSVFLCYAISILIGLGLGSRQWPLRGVDAVCRGIAAEALFFAVTNFAYFLVQSDVSHTSAGLLTCYVAAIPFAWKSFASTIFYSFLLFSPLAVRASGAMETVEDSFRSAATNRGRSF